MNKFTPRKLKISRDEYEKITSQAVAARYFLENPQFKFIIDYIKSGKDSARDHILNNTVTDVTEKVTISDRIKKSFFTPKQVQLDEIKGVYRWTRDFINEMERIAKLDAEIDRKVGLEQLIIDD